MPWLTDPLPLCAWLLIYLLLAHGMGGLAFMLFGNKLLAWAVFIACLVASWFRDPPAL